jgi:regulatory protein
LGFSAVTQGPPLELERALALAYAHLNRRERTVHELREHLRRQGVGPEVTGEVLRELRELGYLDDARFARLYAQDRRNLDGWGSERIRRGLEARGIQRELAEEALAGAEPPDRELSRAIALLRRRVPDQAPDRRGRERALGLLLRRGYPYEVACDAVNAHLRSS